MGQQAKYIQDLQQKDKLYSQPLSSHFLSLALSRCALLGAERGLIHMVSLRPALGELTVKRYSPMDAAFLSLSKDTIPQEPEVLYQDSV